ncbi:MAG: hypothetical protein BroJett021_34670 [Chloroflexota bacterium]|nr:MAG: hypothetical protein BroJett021_34670 [Chloroflexota bacterium]
MSAETVKNPANYIEVVADIAFTAGHLIGRGALSFPGDSRQLMSNIALWARNFEEAFDHDKHSDDYMELVDQYAELCLHGEERKVREFLDAMKPSAPVPRNRFQSP